MLEVTVDSMIRISASGIHPKALALIRRALTFPNPEYVKRVRFDRWVGATPEELCLVGEDRRGQIVLPRGAVGVLRDIMAGHTILVLSNRVTHCRQLAEAISDRGISAEALTGSVGKAKRKRVLQSFREGSVKVLCATSLADEGLDIERLSRLILATPARAEGRTIQRLGRLMRPHPGKGTPVLFDLVDEHPMARRQHTARRRAYRKVLGADCMSRRPESRLPLLGAA